MATKKTADADGLYAFKNVSPMGDLDLPLIGGVVQHGHQVKVTREEAKQLVGQEANWQPFGWDAADLDGDDENGDDQ